MSLPEPPSASKVHVTHLGGEYFTAIQEPSEVSVLRSKLFTDGEEAFLRGTLTSQTLCFSVKDAFQIHVRLLLQPKAAAAMGKGKRPGRGQSRQKFAVCLPALEGDLTNSWAWAKMARPLFQLGVSVVLVDLPGGGTSSCGQRVHCSPGVWRAQAAEIICKVLEELCIRRCHLLLLGASSMVLVQMLQTAPHLLEKEHLLHNPVFDQDDLLPQLGQSASGKAGTGPQEAELVRLLRGGVRLWGTYDEDGAGNCRVRSAVSCLLKASEALRKAQITVAEVCKWDICPASVGPSIAVRVLVPSREYKRTAAKFLRGMQPGCPQLASSTCEHAHEPEDTLQDSEIYKAARLPLPTIPRRVGTPSGAPAELGQGQNASGERLRRAGAHHRLGTAAAARDVLLASRPLCEKEESQQRQPKLFVRSSFNKWGASLTRLPHWH